jgi:predicted ATP-grasp superfamily ATP-dependent carboligase
MYRPQGPRDVKCGKELLVPPVALFLLLDDKVETKALFRTLGLATPRSHLRSSGHLMVEKPVRDSAGGIGMRLTKEDARAGHFLEEFIPGCQSIGMQYFLLEQSEFICANEMLFEGETTTFTFYAQRHVPRNQLPPALINECFRLCDYLLDRGYRGLLGIDALVRGTEHYLIEVNPRGIAFLPAFFAAQSLGWSSFITYMNADEPSDGEVVLLDFGRRRKVVRSLRA